MAKMVLLLQSLRISFAFPSYNFYLQQRCCVVLGINTKILICAKLLDLHFHKCPTRQREGSLCRIPKLFSNGFISNLVSEGQMIPNFGAFPLTYS